MKKYIFFLIVFLSVTVNCYSQFMSDYMRNNIREISFFSFKNIKIDHQKFDYSLIRYSNLEGDYQYFVCFGTEKYHNFLNNGKLLLKTKDNQIIELMSIYSHMDLLEEYNILSSSAYFPITIAQLEKLFSGISKIRVEILSYDENEKKPFITYREKEFKKDEMGKLLQTMYTNIEQQSLKEVKNDIIRVKEKR